MKTEFEHVNQLPPYVFATINKMRDEQRAAGKDIFDFGMGSPDTPPADHILQALKDALYLENAHGYCKTEGIAELKNAQSQYYKRRFGVDLDAGSEVIVTIGSKEGIGSLAEAMTSKGDIIIVPKPCYPIHKYAFVLAGAEIEEVDADPEKYLIELKEKVANMPKKPLAIIVNYPGNPTAQVTNLSFYEELVAFCRAEQIYIISDLAYAEIYFEEDKPTPSIMQVEGAKDIAVEFTTTSKTYSMAGWRVGFAVGNKDLIGALGRIKSYLDYGNFFPIQKAAAAALTGPQDCIKKTRDLYKARRDVMVKGLRDAGWNVSNPQASMFIWTRLPEKYKDMNSFDFAKKMLLEAGVVISPGTGFGEAGEGYVRITLVESLERIEQAVANIAKIL